jgi:hypothetical protein
VTAPKSRIGDKARDDRPTRSRPLGLVPRARKHAPQSCISRALYRERQARLLRPARGRPLPSRLWAVDDGAGDVARLGQLHAKTYKGCARSGRPPSLPPQPAGTMVSMVRCSVLALATLSSLGGSPTTPISLKERETNLSFRCAPPRFSVQVGVTIRGKDCCPSPEKGGTPCAHHRQAPL